MSTLSRLSANLFYSFLICCFLVVGGETANASTFRSPCPNIFGNTYWACVYDGFNRDTVFNNPPIDTVFTLDRSREIVGILTYHYNNGAGQDPVPINGEICIYDQANGSVGCWPASTIGPPESWYWAAYPNMILNPGTYRIVDSDPSTWSYSTTDFFHLPGDGPDWAPSVGFAQVFAEVPEPSSMLLVCGGLAVFGLRRRIRYR